MTEDELQAATQQVIADFYSNEDMSRYEFFMEDDITGFQHEVWLYLFDRPAYDRLLKEWRDEDELFRSGDGDEFEFIMSQAQFDEGEIVRDTVRHFTYLGTTYPLTMTAKQVMETPQITFSIMRGDEQGVVFMRAFELLMGENVDALMHEVMHATLRGESTTSQMLNEFMLQVFGIVAEEGDV